MRMPSRSPRSAAVLMAVSLTAGMGSGALVGAESARAAEPSLANVECSSISRAFQLRAGGTEVWYGSYTDLDTSDPGAYQWTKVGDLPKSRPGKAIAAHTQGRNSVQLIVTDAGGGMRSISFNMDRRTINIGANLAASTPSDPGKYDFDKLASDGSRLYGVRGTELYVMTSITTTDEPRGFARVSGFTERPVTMFGNNTSGSFKLGWTDEGGNLRYSSVRNTGKGWEEQSVTAATNFSASTSIASPGGGVVLRKSADTTVRTLVHPAHGASGNTTVSTSSAPAAGGMTTVPDSCAQKTGSEGPVDLDYATLEKMFGSRLGDRATVEKGLSSLRAAMSKGLITTPERKAAFLATLVNESNVRYNATEVGVSATYKGRGFVQLTGDFNYGPAGDYLNVDLLGNPERAASLQWSAPIARWYWTKARPDLNNAADQKDMGRVAVMIGFAGSSDPGNSSRLQRCGDFKSAYKVLTGQTPAGVEC